MTTATTAAGSPVAISPVEDIVADMRAGRIVILVDEEDRENEGDLVLAALVLAVFFVHQNHDAPGAHIGHDVFDGGNGHGGAGCSGCGCHRVDIAIRLIRLFGELG